MNSSLEETLKPYLEKLLQAVENGAELAAQEIPLVVQEWLMFKGVSYSFWVLISIGLIILSIRIYKPLKNKKDSRFYWPDETLRENGDVAVTFITSFFTGSVGVILFLVNFLDAIKLLFFPRVYLLEMAMRILS